MFCVFLHFLGNYCRHVKKVVFCMFVNALYMSGKLCSVFVAFPLVICIDM